MSLWIKYRQHDGELTGGPLDGDLDAFRYISTGAILCFSPAGEWCPGADYANSINSMTYAKVGQSIFPHDHYAFWRDCPTAGAPSPLVRSLTQSGRGELRR